MVEFPALAKSWEGIMIVRSNSFLCDAWAVAAASHRLLQRLEPAL